MIYRRVFYFSANFTRKAGRSWFLISMVLDLFGDDFSPNCYLVTFDDAVRERQEYPPTPWRKLLQAYGAGG